MIKSRLSVHHLNLLIMRVIGLLVPLAFATQPVLALETQTFASDDYCPYFCKTAGSKSDAFRGFLVDIVEATMGSAYNLEFKLLPWSRALAQAEAGQLSGLVGASTNRKDTFDLSDPVMKLEVCVFGRSDVKINYVDQMSLGQLKMGLIRNYDYTNFREYLKKYGTDPTKVEWITGEDATLRNLNKLVLGRLDGLIDDQFTVSYLAAKHSWLDQIKPLHCTSASYAFHVGMSKKNPKGKKFLELFNKKFAEFKKTDAFRKLEKKYFISN